MPRLQPVLAPLFGLTLAVLPPTASLDAQASATRPSARDLPAPLREAGGRWTLSLDETFDGAKLDRGLWRTALKNAGSDPRSLSDRSLYGNRERQVYFDPEFLGQGVQPITLRHGVMTITARRMTPKVRQAVQEALTLQPSSVRSSALKDVAYTSGLISSGKAFSQTYGYFEMRARWQAGKGLWPAFWLLPENGGWPPEIDIMEALGHHPDRVYQSVHSKAGGKHRSRTDKVTGIDTTRFHTYAALWSPRDIRFFVDGKETNRQATPDDADRPMRVMINLAVGGSWPGDPDASTRFPARMDVDFVRAWRLEGRP